MSSVPAHLAPVLAERSGATWSRLEHQLPARPAVEDLRLAWPVQVPIRAAVWHGGNIVTYHHPVQRRPPSGGGVPGLAGATGVPCEWRLRPYPQPWYPWDCHLLSGLVTRWGERMLIRATLVHVP